MDLLTFEERCEAFHSSQGRPPNDLDKLAIEQQMNRDLLAEILNRLDLAIPLLEKIAEKNR